MSRLIVLFLILCISLSIAIETPQTNLHVLFFAIPMPGHVNPLLAQAWELAERGFRVSFATAASMRGYVDNNKHPRVQFIPAGECTEFVNQFHGVAERAAATDDFRNSTDIVFEWLHQAYPCQFRSLVEQLAPAIAARREGKRLNLEAHNNVEVPVDLMVIDIVTYAGKDVADVLDIPYVVNNPDLLNIVSPRLVPPMDSAPRMLQEETVYDVLAGFPQAEPLRDWFTSGTLLARIVTPLLRPIVMLYIKVVQQVAIQKHRWKEHWGMTEAPPQDNSMLAPLNLLEQHMHKFFIQNTAFGLEPARYIPPTLRMVGPCIQPNQLTSLDERDRTWLSSIDLPVIYISMGTLAQLNQHQLRELLKGLLELGANSNASTGPQLRVLWKVGASQVRDIAKLAQDEFRMKLDVDSTIHHTAHTHAGVVFTGAETSEGASGSIDARVNSAIRVTPWVSSQIGVLQHKNTAVFISHCGVNSVQEAVWAAGGNVQVLCIPMFCDQRDMAQQVRDAGIGAYIYKHTFTSKQVKDMIHSLLARRDLPSIRQRGQRARALLRIAGGASAAADHIELALKTLPNSSHFVPSSFPKPKWLIDNYPALAAPPTSFSQVAAETYHGSYITLDPTGAVVLKHTIADDSVFTNNTRAETLRNAIRHPGAALLSPFDQYLSEWQWLGLDLILSAIFVFYLLRFLVRKACCCLCVCNGSCSRQSLTQTPAMNQRTFKAKCD